VVICLEQGADLHLAQLMPLPLTVSCFSKIQIGSTFLVPAHLGSPGKRAIKWMSVCVCVCVHGISHVCKLITGRSDTRCAGFLKGRFYGMGTFDLGTLSNLYVRTAFLISNIYDGCTIVAI